MGFNITKKTYGYGAVPIWQTKRSPETVQGGFTLDQEGLTPGYVIPGGSSMVYDESTRKAKLIKVAVLATNAANNAVNYQVLKGHTFKVGDNFAAKEGGAAYPITAINTANANYDVLTVGTTLGETLTAGAGVFQSTATGANVAGFPGDKALLYDAVEVEPNATVTVAVGGAIYERRIPAVPDFVKSALPKITFSKSF